MLIKTKNQKGFMHQISSFSQQLIKDYANQSMHIADIGCAYGNFIGQARKNNISVDGYDIESQHLAMIEKDEKINLYRKDIRSSSCFVSKNYDAIHASHVLEYIAPAEINQVIKNIYQALKNGGRFYLLTYTPFIKEYANERFIKEYKKRLSYTFFPGYMENIDLFASDCDDNDNSSENYPLSIHLYSISSISRILEMEGFFIEFISYLDGTTNHAAPFTLNDGRELLGVIARKP